MKKTLAVPIIGLLLGAAALTLAIVYLINVRALQDALEEREADKVESIKFVIQSLIDEDASEISALVRLLKENRELSSALAGYAESGDDSRLNNVLDRLRPGGGVILTVTDDAGLTVYGPDRPEGQGGGQNFWGLYEALQGEEILSTAEGPEGWVMRAVAPLYKEDRVEGAVMVGTRVDDALARRISSETNTQVSLSTIDRVLASSLPPGERYSVDLGVVRRTLKDSGGPVFIHDLVGRKVIMYAPVRVIDETLCLVVESDTSAAHGFVARKKKEMASYFLAIVTLIVVLGSVLTAHIIRPLKTLRKKSREVIKEYSGKDAAGEKGDEVEAAATAFDLMLGAIDEHISGRVRAEDAHKLYVEALEAAPDGVQIVDLAGFVIYSNRAVQEIYGYSPAEFEGKHVNYMNVDPEFAERVILPSVRNTGKWTGELAVRHKNGGAVPVWLTASLVKNKKGAPVAMVGVIRDITGLKRMEAEREKLIAELQEALVSIKTLKGLIPICAWCKKARNDRGYWDNLENFVREHSSADFTHGICPDCMRELEREEEEREKDSGG
jgi:PAS domain S-box-containing protein